MTLESIKIQKEMQSLKFEKEKKEVEMKELYSKAKTELGETRFFSFLFFHHLFLDLFIFFLFLFRRQLKSALSIQKTLKSNAKKAEDEIKCLDSLLEKWRFFSLSFSFLFLFCPFFFVMTSLY